MTDYELYQSLLGRGRKFRFDGLSGDGRTGSYFETVGEAATYDERFMEKHISDIQEYEQKELEAAVTVFLSGDPEHDEEPDEDDDELGRFIEWLRMRASLHESVRAAAKYTVRELLLEYGDGRKDEFIYHLWEGGDRVQHEWDMIKEYDEGEYILNDHPIIKAYSFAAGEGYKLDAVAFYCPSCDKEPQHEDDIFCEGGGFHCGSCGSYSYLRADDDYTYVKKAMTELLFGENQLSPIELRTHGYGEEIEMDPLWLHNHFMSFVEKYWADSPKSIAYYGELVDKFPYQPFINLVAQKQSYDLTIFSFLEEFEVDIYPFCREKRLKIVDQAMQHELAWKSQKYWFDQAK